MFEIFLLFFVIYLLPTILFLGVFVFVVVYLVRKFKPNLDEYQRRKSPPYNG